MTDEQRRFHSADIARHLDITTDEFASWLSGEQGTDWPPAAGEDDDGPYWYVDDLSAWYSWFEEG